MVSSANATPCFKVLTTPATYSAAPALRAIISAAFLPASVSRLPKASRIKVNEALLSATSKPTKLWLSSPTSSGVSRYSRISPSFSSATSVADAKLISSKPSLACTTITCSAPRRFITSAKGRQSSELNTPKTKRFTPAGFVSGPKILKIVR